MIFFQSYQEGVEEKENFSKDDGEKESLFYFPMNCKALFLAVSYLPKLMQMDTFYMSGKEKKHKKTHKKNA